MLRSLRNTCFSLSLGLIVSGLLTASTGIAAIVPIPTLIGTGIAAGAIGCALEVIAGGHR